MNELMNSLGRILEKRNFSKTDINKIYSRIAFVGYCPFALVDAPINNVYITPIYDSVGSLKLVMDNIKRKRTVSSSVDDINIPNIAKASVNSQHYFRKVFRHSINNQDLAYFKYKKSLIVTPNLLYFNGIKEDHKLAGVIHYPQENPYQTEAGKATTKLMEYIFKYCLLQDRQKFSVDDIYDYAVNNMQQREIDTIKEL